MFYISLYLGAVIMANFAHSTFWGQCCYTSSFCLDWLRLNKP